MSDIVYPVHIVRVYDNSLTADVTECGRRVSTDVPYLAGNGAGSASTMARQAGVAASDVCVRCHREYNAARHRALGGES